MRRLLSLCFLIAVCLSAVNAGQCDSCGPALSKLLQGFVLHVPSPQSFTSSGYTVTFSNFVCYNLNISSINLDSTIVTDGRPTLAVNLTGGGGTCGADYQLNSATTGANEVNGQFRGSAQAFSDNMTLLFTLDGNGIPIGLNMSFCQFNIQITNISYNDSAALSAISVFMAPLINDVANAGACPGLNLTINDYLSPLMAQDLPPLLLPYINVTAQMIQAPSPVNPRAYNTSLKDDTWLNISSILKSYGTNNDLLINNIINNLTDGTGVISIPIPAVPVNLGDIGATVTVTIQNVTLLGQTSYQEFWIMQPVHNISWYHGDYSMRHVVALESPGLYFAMNMNLTSGSLFSFDGSLDEDVAVQAGLTNLRANLVVHVEADGDKLWNQTTIGQIEANPTGCISPNLLKIYVTYEDISFDDITYPVWSGLGGLAPLFNEGTNVTKNVLGKLLPNIIHGFLATTGRDLGNNISAMALDLIHQDIGNNCPDWVPGSARAIYGDAPINEQTDPIFHVFSTLFQWLAPDSAVYYPLNRLIQVFTDPTPGTYVIPGNWTNGTISAQDPGGRLDQFGIDMIQFAVGNITVSNIDSFYDFNMINPSSPVTLHNELAFGGPVDYNNSFTVAVDVWYDVRGVAVRNDANQMYDHFQVVVSLTNQSAITDVNLVILNYLVFDLPLNDALYNITALLNNAATVFNFSYFNLDIYKFRLGINCYDCRSPLMANWSQMLTTDSAADALTTLLKNDAYNLVNSPAGLQIINNYVTQNYPVRGFVYVPPVAAALVIPTEFIVGGILAALGGAYYLYTKYQQKKKLEAEEALTGGSKKPQKLGLPLLQALKRNDDESSIYWQLNNIPLKDISTNSKWAKVVVPVFLFGNIICFISAHFIVPLTAVIATVIWAGTNIITPPFFAQSLSETVRTLSQGGFYFLAFLIALLGAVWPYTKSLSMIACWYTKPEKLTVKRRTFVLHWLDILGKWALIDIYVMVILMVGFKFRVFTPNGTAYVPDNMMFATILVNPQAGAYLFVSALFMQLGVNHIMLFYNDIALEESEKEEEELLRKARKELEGLQRLDGYANDGREQEPSVLRMSAFDEARQVLDEYNVEQELEAMAEESELDVMVRLTPKGKNTMTAALGISALLMLISCGIPAFSITFQGILGAVMIDTPFHDFSITLIISLLWQNMQANFGFIILVVSFTMFALIMPILVLCLLGYLWVVPRPIQSQKNWLKAVELIRPLAAVDVFIAAVCILITQISQIGALFVANSCDQINMYLQKYANGYIGGANTCMSMQANLTVSGAMLLIAVITNAVAANVMAEFVRNALRNPEQSEEVDKKEGNRALQNWKVSLRYDGQRYKFLTSFGLIEQIPRERVKSNMSKRATMTAARKVIDSRISIRMSLHPGASIANLGGQPVVEEEVPKKSKKGKKKQQQHAVPKEDGFQRFTEVEDPKPSLEPAVYEEDYSGAGGYAQGYEQYYAEQPAAEHGHYFEEPQQVEMDDIPSRPTGASRKTHR